MDHFCSVYLLNLETRHSFDSLRTLIERKHVSLRMSRSPEDLSTIRLLICLPNCRYNSPFLKG